MGSLCVSSILSRNIDGHLLFGSALDVQSVGTSKWISSPHLRPSVCLFQTMSFGTRTTTRGEGGGRGECRGDGCGPNAVATTMLVFVSDVFSNFIAECVGTTEALDRKSIVKGELDVPLLSATPTSKPAQKADKSHLQICG